MRQTDPERRAVSARAALEGVWALGGGDPRALERVELAGEEPALPSVFPIGVAASACIGAAGLAASELWRLRAGAGQPVRVAMRNAAVAYRSEHYLRVDGEKVAGPDRARSYFRDASGRWMQLHMGYAHHRNGILRELGCHDDVAEIARAFGGRDAFEFEDTLAARGLPGYALRTRGEWAAHPQAAALAAVPVIEIARFGGCTRVPPPRGRPAARRSAGGRPYPGHRGTGLRPHPSPRTARTCSASIRHTSPRCRCSRWTAAAASAARTSTSATAPTAAPSTPSSRAPTSSCRASAPAGSSALGYAPEAVAERRPGIVYVTLSALERERALGRAARIRQPRADRDRHRRRGERGAGRRRARAPPLPGPRPQRRLPSPRSGR